MTALPDPDGTRVGLIGASEFTSLNDLPAVAGNPALLRDLFTDLWKLPPGHVTGVANPSVPRDVSRPVQEAVDTATDTLLVYYAGHSLQTLGWTRPRLRPPRPENAGRGSWSRPTPSSGSPAKPRPTSAAPGRSQPNPHVSPRPASAEGFKTSARTCTVQPAHQNLQHPGQEGHLARRTATPRPTTTSGKRPDVPRASSSATASGVKRQAKGPRTGCESVGAATAWPPVSRGYAEGRRAVIVRCPAGRVRSSTSACTT